MRRWIVPESLHPEHPTLARALGVSPILAHLLLARGVTTEGEGRSFLQPDLSQLHDPLLLPDAEVAVARIAEAIRRGERILVHGDYDVDGVCAAALLTRVLRVLKANVEPFVPHRREDGYDLSVSTVKRAYQEGFGLIITVDCGIVAFEAAEAARALGVDLIVTDHHEPEHSGRIPAALAVVNPKRIGSRYPFQELCGTAVAFKLATALVQHLDLYTPAFRTHYLDLVALATCADCMPLKDENRVFVKVGLDSLRTTRKAGLRALLQVVKLDAETLATRHLAFTIGPRINAVGRMGDAEVALRLLLTSDAGEAAELARLLDETNRERQVEQEAIHASAVRQLEHYLEDPILVLSSDRWHSGIIGIVASKVVETQGRPAILISIDETGVSARGSCRSIEGFSIVEALQANSSLLKRCGGHEAAAGFDIDPARIEDLRAALREYGREHLTPEMLVPRLRLDAELPAEAIEMRLAHELGQLEPFGYANPEPLFVTRGLSVLEQRRIGSRSGSGPDHLKLRVGVAGQRYGLEALFWRHWSREADCRPGARIDACYSLARNTHNGYHQLQLNLEDLSPSAGDAAPESRPELLAASRM